MKRILALMGSGEFTDSMMDVDKFLLSHLKNPQITIIPTAAGQEANFAKWIESGVRHFKRLGFKAKGVHLIKKSDTRDKKILEQLAKSNFYYFSGGNPGHLLDVIKDSPAWELIYKNYLNGAILAGSSAGAMVMGDMVWARVYDFVEKDLLHPLEKGLGVVNFTVIPHFNLLDEEFTETQKKDMKKVFNGTKTVGIEEDTAYIQIERSWKVLGKGKVHSGKLF